LPAHNSVAGGRGEEGVLVVDEEEVGLVLVEGRGEVVGLGVHDVIGQAERRGQPVHGHLAVVQDVVGLEGNLDLQLVGEGGQHLPRSVDLQEEGLPVVQLLQRERERKRERERGGGTREEYRA